MPGNPPPSPQTQRIPFPPSSKLTYTYASLSPPDKGHDRALTGMTGRCATPTFLEKEMGDPERSSNRRLDSWKEIAAFFGRDERTVRRWEKENSLPVHRVPGGAKGRVFAYESELASWLSSPPGSQREEETAAHVIEIPVKVEAGTHPVTDHKQPVNWRVALKWAGAVVALGLVAFGLLAYRKEHGFAVHAAGGGNRIGAASAEDFYLKGRYYWNKRTPDDLQKAVDLFTQAIVQDPGYAPAYVGLADCYNLLREFSVMPPEEAYPRARAAAQKAVDLDPNSAEAQNSLAFALFWGSLDIAGAENHFQRALELEPGNTQAHHWYATFLAELARFPEALTEIERARELDPSSTPILADKGFILGMAGRTEEAISLLKQIAAAEPAFLSPHQYLAEIYFYRGEYRLYFDEVREAARLRHDAHAETQLMALEKRFATGGPRGLLEARLHADQELHDQGLSSDFDLALDYSLLNDRPDAVRCLQNSLQRHELELTSVRVNRAFANVRHEHEFGELLAKLGFPPVT